MDLFSTILAASAITISVIEDIRRQKIPNFVTFPTIVLALAGHSTAAGLDGFLFSVGGLAAGMGLFILPYALGGMGAGDVKLMGATGAILGAKGVLIASVLVILAGGVYGVILMALNPGYTAGFAKRAWMTVKSLIFTHQFFLIPPEKNEKRPVLKYAVPIAVGVFGYMAMQISGYDLFPELLGENFTLLSIASVKGGF